MSVDEALRAARGGGPAEISALYERVYAELHQLAHGQRRRWSGNDTLDTTSLLHETYAKLIDRDEHTHSHKLADLGHFFAVAATAMRHILIDYAKGQQRKKRGGDYTRVDWTERDAASRTSIETMVDLAHGLERLGEIDARRARVFELRFLFGFSVEETSEVLSISPATVKRDWNLAAEFLRDRLDAKK